MKLFWNLATSNSASMYFLHPSDYHKLMSDVFTSVGYGDWKRSMLISLYGKIKVGFVDGTITKPSSDSPTAKAWGRVNNIVIGWILVVLENSIAKSVLWFNVAHEIWNELEEWYGQTSSAQLFSLQEEINKISQSSEMNIAKFFPKIKPLWDKLDNFDLLPTYSCYGCSCNLNNKMYHIW